MILKQYCGICNKKVDTVSENILSAIGLKTRVYSCGHQKTVRPFKAADFSNIVSSRGHRPYKYQIEGAVFGLNSDGRFQIQDQMGLGKTVQFFMVAREIKKQYPKSKFMIVCKARLQTQMMKACTEWLGEEYIPQIIENENDFCFKGTCGIIVSYDRLWRFKDIPAFLERFSVNFLCLDEGQHVKNSDSKRTKGCQIAAQEVSYFCTLSGTLIKNNSLEYFPILNMTRPDKFPTRSQYEQVWVDSYWDGHKMKYGGLKSYERFKEYTKDFIIRRTREEVLPDLPKVEHNHMFTDLGVEVEQAYKDLMKEFQQYYNYGSIDDTAIQKSACILSYLSKMRHLTGLAKVEYVVSFVQDFLESTDRKITIFLHHKDVGETLISMLDALNIKCIQLRAGSDTSFIVEKFQKDDSIRVLIASTLASGEGVDGIQKVCGDIVIMERQWNPANEQQVEGRIERLGQVYNHLTSTYMIAVGTVDEFFAELVEKKRAIVGNTLDGTEAKWEENSLIQELAEVLAQKGGQKWGF